MTETGPLDGASAGRTIALTVRFLLELALLAGVAVLTWNLTVGWWRWPAAILGVAVVATVWGLFLSPKAAVPLRQPAPLGIEVALFVGTGAGLLAVGFGISAGIGVGLWIIDRIALALIQN
ncbi:YrdB family protein [Microbacterium suwonense]|uniref:YrdB family protein n=1 Tax=Microbacterium suwonense TaxID=683047 RepID=UPI00257349AA|nr:YrdB family protein [Microbacterium suwonense]